MTDRHKRADAGAGQERGLYVLIGLALLFAIGHHLDHVIRGNHVGWPVNGEVNAFTYSLGIYPAIVTGLILYRARMVGPGFWIVLSGGGALFLAAIHFGPFAIEPPQDIIGLYQPPVVGWLAFAWLLGLVAVLIIATVYETRLWLAGSREAQAT